MPRISITLSRIIVADFTKIRVIRKNIRRDGEGAKHYTGRAKMAVGELDITAVSSLLKQRAWRRARQSDLVSLASQHHDACLRRLGVLCYFVVSALIYEQHLLVQKLVQSCFQVLFTLSSDVWDVITCCHLVLRSSSCARTLRCL